jgi:hypothetical protein
MALLQYDECDYDRLHVWSYFANDEGVPTPGLELYWDEIYVDRTQARVEIGNAATWSASSHLELQIPSAWSDDAIRFEVKRGAFEVGGQAFVYVVDADGNVNEAGLAVTFEP